MIYYGSPTLPKEIQKQLREYLVQRGHQLHIYKPMPTKKMKLYVEKLDKKGHADYNPISVKEVAKQRDKEWIKTINKLLKGGEKTEFDDGFETALRILKKEMKKQQQ